MNWAASGSKAVPNFTVADTGGTGGVEIYNSHGATVNILIDAFGYFERQLPTSVAISESPTTVTYGHESATVFSVTVAAQYGEAVPNGEAVTTTVGSVPCKVVLKSDKGTCTIDNTALAVGAYPVSATYGGDANLSGSSGTSVSQLTVSKDVTLTAVSKSPTTVTYGHESATVFSVTVAAQYGEAVPNGEAVTTTVGSVPCKVVLKSDKGTCTIDNTALAVGAYPVSATYGGDANLSGSSGTSVSQLTVSKDVTLTAVSESPTSSHLRQRIGIRLLGRHHDALWRGSAQCRDGDRARRLGLLHRCARGWQRNLHDWQHCSGRRYVFRVGQLWR